MLTIEERMSAKTTSDPSGCDLWTGALNSRGYGVVWFEGRLHLAHRVAWRLHRGRWPAADRVLDHVCETKSCVAPGHLRELANWQNVRRAHPAKSDPKAEAQRAANRRSQAKSRGSYSSDYVAERG